MIAAPSARESDEILKVALGQRPAHMIIHGGRILDVYAGRVLENFAIATWGKWIASVSKDPMHFVADSDTAVIDADGYFLSPGFIDTHTHIDTITSLDCLSPVIFMHGTTTIATEVYSIANTAGLDGLKWYLEICSKCPFNVLVLLPAISFLYGKAPEGGPCLTEKQMNFLLRQKHVVGIGECSWKDLIENIPMQRLVRRARTKGMAVDGHGTGVRENLAAWASLGVLGDHECVHMEDVKSRLEMGIYALIREGSKRSDLQYILAKWDNNTSLDHITLATDTMLPHDIAKKGYMDFLVKILIKHGFNPITAITLATRNAASYLGVEMTLGAILPGRFANLLFLSDLEKVRIDSVLCKGKFVIKRNEPVIAEAEPAKDYPRMRHLDLLSEKDIMPPPCPPGAKIRAVKMSAPTLTREIFIDEVQGKRLRKGLCMMVAVSRHSTSKLFVGYVDDFGLEKGALANSISFGESAICSIGADVKSVLYALNRVLELGGGIVASDQERIIDELPLPIAGVQSDQSFERVAAFLVRLPVLLKDWGCKWDDPLYSLRTLTFSGLPDLRITTKGYFNVLSGSILPLFA